MWLAGTRSPVPDATDEVDTALGAERGAAGQPRGMSVRTATVASVGVVLVVVAALAIREPRKRPAAASPPAAVTRAVGAPAGTAPAPSAPTATKGLPGDSMAVGLGPAAKGGGRGKAPREVTADAVALLQLTLPRARATVGDTIHARLEATDDSGNQVTTPQIVWTTSNASVVRFAGPGELIAVKEGKATINVAAGSTNATREVTVVTKKR